jgi:hypothetical protein
MKPYIEAIARRWAVMDGKDPDANAFHPSVPGYPDCKRWECYAEEVAYMLEAIKDEWAIVPRVATDAMLREGTMQPFQYMSDDTASEVYAAMIAEAEKI